MMKYASGFLVGLLVPLCSVAAPVHYRSDFAASHDEWSGYNETKPVPLSVRKENGRSFLRFAPGGGTWNQPILQLPRPITVSAWTMIRFQVRMPVPFHHEMVIHDRSESVDYGLKFLVNGTEWITVQKYLMPAQAKTADPAHPNDGLNGDEIDRITWLLWGEPIDLADVEIFESEGGDPELPADTDAAAVDDYLAHYRLRQFAVFQRNGFFPYGPVSRIDANAFSAAELGRPLEEGLVEDLRDMRVHHCNTYLNFCDPTPPASRRAALDRSGMRLIETMFSNTRFGNLPDDAAEYRALAEQAAHPGLLAWYGHDEPLPGSYGDYVRNKQAVERRDPAHPFTSAFNVPISREKLGPGMEVLIPDVYSLKADVADPRQAILDHFRLVREAKRQSAGGNVWFMTQTFNQRSAAGSYAWRFPTPEELRLDLHTLAAAGVDGILFFIYNELTPYLSGTSGERFDRTLVDAWGNGNAVYEEIAAFGRAMVPILPSLLDAEPTEALSVDHDPQLLLGESANQLGTYLYFVNTSLTATYAGTPAVALAEGMRLYNLGTLQECEEPSLSLPPGEGMLFVVAAPENFATLAGEIRLRRETRDAELAELERAVRREAGFSDGVASPEWEACGRHLAAVAWNFGQLNTYLTDPVRAARCGGGVPGAAELHGHLKDLSRRYFTLRAQWRQGTVLDAGELRELAAAVLDLGERYQAKFP